MNVRTPNEHPQRGTDDAAPPSRERRQPGPVAGRAEVALKSTRWGLWAALIAFSIAILVAAWVGAMR
jgi:hypothetical protein